MNRTVTYIDGLYFQNEVPLRMTVDAKYVGAIIGQQGNKIKEITRESKAKCIVDAQKGMRDPQGSSEKVGIIVMDQA